MHPKLINLSTWLLKGLSVIVLFFKYFLPIIAISVLVNVICFPSSFELFLLLAWKSILTTIITVALILYGVKREKEKHQKSKIRLFLWFFLPMIPYVELAAIALYEQDILLFCKKTLVYLLAYGVLAVYYTFSTEIREMSRFVWQIKAPNPLKRKKKRGWISLFFSLRRFLNTLFDFKF